MPRQSKAVPLLNDQAVKAAKCIDGCRSDGSAGPVLTTYRIANSDRLELVVQPPNSGTYYVRYTLDGQRKRVRIGRRDKIALADARAEARRIAAEVDAGRDPASERLQAVDARAKAAASPPLRKLWEDRKAHGELRPATVATYEQALQQFVFPTLGDTPAATITKDQLNSLLKGVRDGNSKHRAHSVRGALGSIFSGALDQGDVATDPTDGLKFVYKAKRARERKSGADEIGIVWRGIENAATANNGLTKRMQAILKLVILTGQRVSTVCGARADELKLGVVNPVWTISAGRMKVEKEHAIPLTPHVAGLLPRSRQREQRVRVRVPRREGHGCNQSTLCVSRDVAAAHPVGHHGPTRSRLSPHYGELDDRAGHLFGCAPSDPAPCRSRRS